MFTRNSIKYSTSIARKRISSLTLAITNKQEVAAPMCALYLLRCSPFYFSHDEASLNLKSWFHYLDNDEIPCSLSRNTLLNEDNDEQQTYSLRSALLNYIYRPNKLEKLTLYVFTSKYSECMLSLNSVLPKNKYRFRKNHPQYASKGLVLNSPFRIPNIHGCTIPDKNRLEDHEDAELYGKSILTLFKPFRVLLDLKSQEVSWYNAYSSYTFDEYSSQIQNYYEIRSKAQETLTNAKSQLHLEKELLNDALVVTENDSSNELILCNQSQKLPDDTYIIPFAYSENLDDYLNPALSLLSSLSVLPSDDIKRESPDLISLFPRKEACLSEEIDTRFSYEFLGVMEHDNIQSVFINQWNLNIEQKAAFIMYTNVLAKSWDNTSQNNLLGYLGGQGGTGKSQLIKCLLSFVSYHNKQHTVLVSAYTGKASLNVQGVTLHSLLSYKNLLRSTTEYSMSLKTKRILLDVKLLFIDECSMISKRILAKIDSILQWVTGSNLPFGGIHVILAGDFLQLPPVKCKDSLFTDLSKLKDPSVEEQRGFHLWGEHMGNAIILLQNYRQKDDPEWARYCNDARFGIWSDEFVNLINSRHISKIHELPPQFKHNKYTPIVTPLNSRRFQINLQYIRSVLKTSDYNKKIYRLVANISCKLGSLSDSDIPVILSLSDEKFDKLCPLLDIFIGMPVTVTQNVNKTEGVVNGSVFLVKSINFADDTTFSRIYDPYYEAFLEIPSITPESLLLFSPTDSREVLLFPINSTKWTKISISFDRFKEIKLKQFPCVSAIGSSVYKIQGDTLNSMIIDSWWSNTGADCPEQGYVYVSRVTSRYSLLILEELTKDVVSKFKSSTDAIELEKQLHDISKVNVYNVVYRPVPSLH